MEASTATSRLHPQSLLRFKKLLPKDLVVSVQVKPELISGCRLEDDSNNCRRVFFRIATAQRRGAAAAAAAGEEEELIGARPCFLAYYPGEPYFYCNSRDPDHTIVKARRSVGSYGDTSASKELCVSGNAGVLLCQLVRRHPSRILHESGKVEA